ncbi:EAL domain-containing protein [Jannaschia sp. M317]|uniref:EAL domain-containing protein n=1 Tax=Jannaschia sp. M317 TaxID=2867011 RepID=UPI0021A62BF6|nr:EAL domain-containing protein [Jannaschia sp. M317]UWQ17868.1 EAL domain-containing protein [Jannaschia sp. M317]
MPRRTFADVVPDDPLTYAVTERDRDILNMVRGALTSGEVILAFQPVVSAETGAPVFYEGLIRLLDETGRIIPAGQFIDVIEAEELGRQIDCVALNAGFDALSRQPDLRLSINMSARSIGYPRWMQILHHWIDRDPTVAERLILEVTESSAMLVPELVKSFMAELQDKGITFALDDFGAGQTSFRYLKEFYFDILKIDGSFIHDCHKDPDNQCLLKALIMIGQQFDMFTVAESVETKADAQFLVDAGIDCLQGYYYGAPLVRPPWEGDRPALQPAPARRQG